MKRILLSVIFLLTLLQGYSQTRGISYQAVILSPDDQEIPGVNVQGNILANSAVSIQFTIVDATNNEEYQEYHTTSTDMYGMINLLIGNGTITSSNNFEDIVWDGTTKMLNVAIDFSGNGSNFTPLSVQHLSYMPQPLNDQSAQLIAEIIAAQDLIEQDLSGIATNASDISDIQAEQLVQDTAISDNASSITTIQGEQTTQDNAIALNTAKAGITVEQATIIENTNGINTGDQDISGIATNASSITTIQGEQTTQDNAIALNTAKAGITVEQATIIQNTSGINTGDQDISGIATNASSITTIQGEQTTQDNAIALNTAKAGITVEQATIIENTSGINTGDQDILGIATNASAITTLQGEQTTQDNAIALNAAKVGITVEQATIIQNTSGINTGDQDISGIATNATEITTLQSEQTTQNTAISANTVKVGYTDALVSANTNVVANTNKVGITNGQISAITANTNDVIAIKTEQITQNTEIGANSSNLVLKEELANKNVANGYAGLDSNAKIDLAQLPAITMNNIYTVTSDAEQIALTATQGDVAIRTDILKNYIHNGGSAGTLTDWTELAAPGVEVTSVNGKTGNVVIGISDIATLQTALDAKMNVTNLATVATSGSYSDLTGVPATIDTDKTDDLLVTDLMNNLSSGGTDKALTAEQGKILKDLVDVNTSKTGITAAQTSEIAANTLKVSYPGDQDISGITDNAGDISTLQTAQTTQNTAIALNTDKTGITTAQTNEIAANTLKVSYPGDQDISGIVTNASDISTLQSEQTTQNTAISANTAKVGYTEALVSANTDVVANTNKVGITNEQISAITANTNEVIAIKTEQITQNTEIGANTTNLALKEELANKNVANGYAGLDSNAKIDLAQLPAITMNNIYTVTSDVEQIALTATQGDVVIRTDILKNYIHNGGSAGTLTDWTELVAPGVEVTSVNGKTGNVVIGISDIATLQTALDAKMNATNLSTVATSGSFSDLTGVPINLDIDHTNDLLTTDLVNDLTSGGTTKVLTAEQGKILKDLVDVNTSKTGITTAQTNEIAANTLKVSYPGDQDISGITANATDISTLQSEQTTQNTAIALNTDKVGYTEALVSANTDVAANTLKVSYPGDQDISGITANATDISTLQSEQTTQNTAIALNTDKVGYTEALVSANTDVAANTLKVSYPGDQDISGIVTNAGEISTLQGEQTTQNTAIALNTAKVGYTEALVSANTDVAANTLKVSYPGDQDISGIATNAGDISTLQEEQTTQDAAIALNTAKLGTVGDIKQGFQAADHSGWVKLDGRVVSSLTATQQTEATTLGFTVNLPDASNTFLVQNGNTLGSVSGSNTKTVSQANLPNVNFSGTAATAGNHTHSITEPPHHYIAHSQTATAAGGFASGGFYGPWTSFRSVTINAAGDHTHTVSVSSGGSGTALDITPKSLSINTFVYLGN